MQKECERQAWTFPMRLQSHRAQVTVEKELELAKYQPKFIVDQVWPPVVSWRSHPILSQDSSITPSIIYAPSGMDLRPSHPLMWVIDRKDSLLH